MLTIPKRFPFAKAATLGVGVFVIGLVGSVTLLHRLHPGQPDDGGTNVATRPSASETADKKKAVASAEPSARANAGRSGTVSVTGVMPEKNATTQPVAKYTTPSAKVASSNTSPKSSSTSSVSISTPPLEVSSSPTQPTGGTTQSNPTTDGTSSGSLLQQTVQPTLDTTTNLAGSLPLR